MQMQMSLFLRTKTDAFTVNGVFLTDGVLVLCGSEEFRSRTVGLKKANSPDEHLSVVLT